MAQSLARDGGGAAPTEEVTTAMMEAGVLALYDFDNDEKFNSAEERVARVFLAMLRARSD